MKNRRGKHVALSTTQSLIILPLFLFCTLLVLTRLTDHMTPAYLGTALMIYMIGYCASIACRTRVTTVVRMYFNNQFFLNCRDYLNASLYKSLALFALFSLLLILFGASLSTLLTGTTKGRLVFYMLVLLLMLTAAESVISGFIAGMGKKRTQVTYDMIQAVTATALMVVLSLFGYRYGTKVDALLYTADCAGLYAAFAGIAGIAIATFIKLLFLFLTKRRILKKLSPLHETGKPKYLGEASPFFKAIGSELLISVTLPVSILFGTTVYIRTNLTSSLLDLGIFYGRYLSYVMIFGLICTLPFLRMSYRLTQPFVDDEPSLQVQQYGELFIILLRKQTLFAIPVGTFLMALAPCLDSGIFLLKNETADLLMTYGGFVSTLMALALIFSILLIRTKRMMPLLICAFAATLGSIVISLLTILILTAGISGVVVALLAYGFIFCVLSIFMLKAVFGMRRVGVFRMISKTFIMAALSALAVFLLSSAVKYLIGEIPACVIGLFSGICIYLILLAVFRSIEADELRAIPGGSLLEKIAMRAQKQIHKDASVRGNAFRGGEPKDYTEQGVAPRSGEDS